MNKESLYHEFSFTSTRNDFSYILNNPVYMYTKDSVDSVPIPISKGQVKELVSGGIGKKVFLNNIEIYSDIAIKSEKNRMCIILGKGIEFDVKNKKIHYEERGTLSERIKDKEFAILLSDGQELAIDSLNFGKVIGKITNYEGIKSRLEFLKKLQSMLLYFGVEDEIDISKLNEIGLNDAKTLILSLENNNTYKFDYEIDIPALAVLTIANLKLVVYAERLSNDTYRFINLFEYINQSNIRCIIDLENNNHCKGSAFVTLKYSNFCELSNIDYEILSKNISSYDYTSDYGSILNLLVLDMLQAYDTTKRQSILLSATEILKWMVVNEKFDLYMINYLQCIKRTRALNQQEINELISIRNSNINNFVINWGVSVLLNNFDECNFYWEKISQSEQNAISKYPIFNIWKNHF